jgi:uncharacterized protein
LVAGIVKLDDLGLHLMQKKGASFYRQLQRKSGEKILAFAPYLMRTLSVVGTAAMFLVGGSIISHGLPFLHHFTEHLPTLGKLAMDGVVGLAVGAICVALFEIFNKMRKK